MYKLKATENLMGLFKGNPEVKITLSQEQLLGFIQDIANTFAQYRSATSEINKNTTETLNLALKQLNAEHERILGELETTKSETKSDVTVAIEMALSECRKMCDEIMEMKPKDGDNADPQEVADLVLEQIKLPEYEIITPEKTRDSLESLVGNERLDVSAIKGLEDYIQTLKLGFNKVVGGTTRLLTSLLDVSIVSPTNGQVLVYNSTTGRWENQSSGALSGPFIETPGGTPNGVLTTFTVTNEPKWISVDGLNKFVTTNYTYSSGTITITDGAPPVVSIMSFY